MLRARNAQAHAVRRLCRRELHAAREPVNPGSISAMRTVPENIARPTYVCTGEVPHPTYWVHAPGSKSIDGMRKANGLARAMLDYAGSLVKAGSTTDEIDAKVHDAIVAAGAYPSPLGYRFSKVYCHRSNEVICHGIPDSRALEDGDILSIDVSLFIGGYHGDNCGTFLVGNVDKESRTLIDVTQNALDAAIEICGPGVPLNKIGETIQDICDENGLGTVKDFMGHGVGEELHGLPYIAHFKNDFPGEMVSGMTFTIEPMITQGTSDFFMWEDGWTVITQDQGRAAQFEHTILITDHGCEILTVV